MRDLDDIITFPTEPIPKVVTVLDPISGKGTQYAVAVYSHFIGDHCAPVTLIALDDPIDTKPWICALPGEGANDSPLEAAARQEAYRLMEAYHLTDAEILAEALYFPGDSPAPPVHEPKHLRWINLVNSLHGTSYTMRVNSDLILSEKQVSACQNALCNDPECGYRLDVLHTRHSQWRGRRMADGRVHLFKAWD